MKTVTSVSGGKTSAFVAAKYPSDYNLFSLVRVEDQKCRFPDEKVRQYVEDRINAPFVGTIEDDKIIYTMLDLEQFLGRKIHWVTGMTYEKYIKKINGGHLPNVQRRGCTTHLKLIPMAQWWLVNIGEPIKMQIGFRANEVSRANGSLAKVNANGLAEIKIPVRMDNGSRGWRNKNEVFAWQRFSFPLIEDGILKHDIEKYWNGKPVRFARYNNCVICFNRSSLFLAKMFDEHANKMQWGADQEIKNTWKEGIRYEELKKWKAHRQLTFDDFSGCDSGYCEVA